MMKKLIIFDLDGTLIDTLQDLNNAVNHALIPENVQQNLEHTRISIGNGVRKLMERSVPDGLHNPNFETMFNDFKNFYSKNYKVYTTRYNGIFDLISRLKEDGFHLAVCTNKIQSIADDLIKFLYPNLFDLVIGDREGIKKKPDPEMLNIAMSYFGVSTDETLYVGDTNVDLQVALNAHVDYLIVTYGYRTKDELLQYTKNRLIDSPSELYKNIKSFNQ